MFKFAAVVAISASTLLATSAFAAEPSAPVLKVRISLAGKSAGQLATEFKAAAESVCAAPGDRDVDCVDTAIADANAQLNRIAARRHAQFASNAQIVGDDLTVVRISVKGKSTAQIDREIQDAARKVCNASIYAGDDFSACVEASVSVAKLQLRTALAQVGRPTELASN